MKGSLWAMPLQRWSGESFRLQEAAGITGFQAKDLRGGRGGGLPEVTPQGATSPPSAPLRCELGGRLLSPGTGHSCWGVCGPTLPTCLGPAASGPDTAGREAKPGSWHRRPIPTPLFGCQ